MYHLYILKCADQTLYTGITTDLKRRVAEHNDAKLGARYTSSRRPVKLVYSKKFKDRSSVSKEEAQIKNLTRLEKLELIERSQKINKFYNINIMKKHTKIGEKKKKGRTTYRTPSKFAIRKKKHLRRPARLKGKVHKMRVKKKK